MPSPINQPLSSHHLHNHNPLITKAYLCNRPLFYTVKPISSTTYLTVWSGIGVSCLPLVSTYQYTTTPTHRCPQVLTDTTPLEGTDTEHGHSAAIRGSTGPLAFISGRNPQNTFPPICSRSVSPCSLPVPCLLPFLLPIRRSHFATVSFS